LDRQIVYPGAVPLETDLLNTNKNAMFALGQLCQDAFGQGVTGPFFTGLACVPNTPAAMNVIVQPGAVYAQAALDATAYSSLAADSTVTMKQGILKAAQTFATPAPTTSGQSIVYLISASFLEADTSATVLPYYNASNPAQAYSGPNNLGTSQNTLRQDTVQLTLTTGVPATTGSQVTPATPNGQTALYTITVAYGASTVVAGNIAKVSSSAFFPGFVRQDGSTPFTAAQSGVTPAQFDSSTKLATMAALWQRGVAFGSQVVLNGATSLTAALHAGRECTITAASAQTLPLASTCPAGTVIHFCSQVNGASVVRSGSDSMSMTPSSTNNTLNLNDTLTLMSDGNSTWLGVGGSVQFKASVSFATLTPVVQTYTGSWSASYSNNVNVSATAPCAGTVYAFGSLNLAAAGTAGTLATTLYINGSAVSNDSTLLPQWHQGVASVTRGQSIAVQYAAAASAGFSPTTAATIRVGLLFIPS
jgi:hypothetical protein